jgi:hypothetical protein
MIGPADETLRHPPSPLPDRWQENLFVIAWDGDRHAGLMVHLQRVPGRDYQEARFVATTGGRTASAIVEGVYDASRVVAGVDYDVVEPFRRIRLGADLRARDGVGPLGFVATHPPSAGDVRLEVDIELASELPAVDFAEGLRAMTAVMRSNADGPQMGDQAHYEQGGRWSGTIAIGDVEVAGSGLFVRDHSWGVRHEQNDFKAFWTATCVAAEDGSLMFANAIGIPTGDRVAGIGAVADADGVRFTTDVGADYAPRAGVASYDAAEIRYGAPIDLRFSATTQVHWPFYLPHSGPRRYDNNAISAVTLPDGRAGFGVMEWADVLTPDEAAELDALVTG